MEKSPKVRFSTFAEVKLNRISKIQNIQNLPKCPQNYIIIFVLCNLLCFSWLSRKTEKLSSVQWTLLYMVMGKIKSMSVQDVKQIHIFVTQYGTTPRWSIPNIKRLQLVVSEKSFTKVFSRPPIFHHTITQLFKKYRTLDVLYEI